MADFDKIAPAYRRLSALVFGNQLLRAQEYFLEQIPSGSRVLIAGGGTGELLSSLSALQKNLTIDFVDSSRRMIRLARTRKTSDKVRFYQQDILRFHSKDSYQVVITAFFLDCFPDETLEKVMRHLEEMRASDGQWIFTDFMETSRLTHRLLTRLMYIFFRTTAGLRAHRLPGYDRHFQKIGLMVHARKTWRQGYLESRVYREAKGLGTLS